MKPTLSLLAFSSLLLSTVAAQADKFDPNEDYYPFKTAFNDATLNGFTIEYKNYYKIVTNKFTSKTYCLVGQGQGQPEGCTTEGTVKIPVQTFSIGEDAMGVIPFIELLGLTQNVTKTNTTTATSPCVKDSISGISTDSPDMVFSTSNLPSMTYVDFSANDDSLGPLQKASWLMYIGAFFDLELKSYSIYNQIADNYNCHKNNLGSVATPKAVSWTTYQPSASLFTLHNDTYYQQLVEDAGGRLIRTNTAQPNTFQTNDSTRLVPLANAMKGSDYIIDSSDVPINYDTWVKADPTYFLGANGIQAVNAIVDNHVYSTNGLVKANTSDWSQRSAVRPDLALLDLIKLLYPTFSISGDANFPVWLTPFNNETNGQQVTADNYGGCEDMAARAYNQTKCIIGGSGSSQYTKKLSTGETAGISVGTILAVVVAALVGVWLYRRYRRKQRHNFYRMSDL